MPAKRVVSDALVVEAPPEVIFDILADPTKHQAIDGSGSLRGSLGGPRRLSLGARFGMKMRRGVVPYRMTSTVVEFEENRTIAWRHLAHHVWRYELQPLDDGATRVVESFDWRSSPIPWVLEVLGQPEQNRRSIIATLVRLRDLAVAGRPGQAKGDPA